MTPELFVQWSLGIILVVGFGAIMFLLIKMIFDLHKFDNERFKNE